MATYSPADDLTVLMVRDITSRYHQPLADAGVTVCTLFAAATGEGMAVSHNGYPALAKIKINSLRDRVAGMADVTLEIDEQAWKDMPSPAQEALLDHELMHLELKRTKKGEVKTDDAGRPKIGIRKHDFQVGGFYTVAVRHQGVAHEVRQVQEVNRVFRQEVLRFEEAEA